MTTKKRTQADKLTRMFQTGQTVQREALTAAPTEPQTVEMSERFHVSTFPRVDGKTSRRRENPGKRASGYIQIAGLIPKETREALTIALAFESRDLSELLTDLLGEWLAKQPAHVQVAIEASRNE